VRAHGEIAADESHQRAGPPLLFRMAQQRFGGVEWLEFIFGECVGFFEKS
jgi:hypothetical protein